MTATGAIFDGKAFIPSEPAAIPPQSEAWVLVETHDPAAQQRLDEEGRACYSNGVDIEDEDRGRVARFAPHVG